MKRKVPLCTGETYHIFNRSIDKTLIFQSRYEYQRMITAFAFYQYVDIKISFSYYLKSSANPKSVRFSDKEKRVEIIAFCVMPNHFHLALTQLKDNGISSYMHDLQNSFTRYHNIRYDRKGPLWESKFKNVLAENDDHLMYLTQYIHKNPVKSKLSKQPEDWEYSSYLQYVNLSQPSYPICNLELLNRLDKKDYYLCTRNEE